MNKSILILLLAVLFIACGNKTENKQTESQEQEQTVTTADASVVNVYYFHGKQRCKTCIAIENVTKNAVAENYKDNP
ncbi:MAG TPA: hypothetical protein DIT04_04445, partial [Dysgonomonas sp.]|nr:hypothetical protein [Dysgonomonas sp.]